jgi:hypothetical protein
VGDVVGAEVLKKQRKVWKAQEPKEVTFDGSNNPYLVHAAHDAQLIAVNMLINEEWCLLGC